MECIVDLLANGKLDFGPITSDILPFDDAVSVYEKINAGELKGLGILFRYPLEGRAIEEAARPKFSAVAALRVRRSAIERVRLGVIGCGNYATTMLLPHLKGRPDVELVEVATATALSAANAKTKFSFTRMSTDFRALLADADIDAVLIATRHDSHSYMVCEALRAGKAVFVEKPLAVTPEQLAQVRETIRQTGNDRLMVGFNRRFATVLNGMRAGWGMTGGPQVVHYTVNAGPLDAKSWYGQTALQGTRFVGEGGHFIDTISWWLGSEPVEAYAAATPGDADNLIATLTYADGSVAKLAYVTQGDPKYPKEMMEVFADGKVARMDNFRRTEIWRNGKCRTSRAAGIDKGQKQELAAFVDAVKSGGAMPVPVDALIATTAATFAVARSVATRRPERVASWASWDQAEDDTAVTAYSEAGAGQ
jgi:predicted dehydrogenase